MNTNINTNLHSNTSATGRRVAVGCAALLGAAALSLAGASAASAHVSISADTAEAGAYTVLTLSVPHGCDVSPTTRVAIQIPAEITAVTPTRNAFYSVEKAMEQLETPFTDGHGNKVTERVAEIVYTANTPLPADQRDTFEIQLQLPEDAAGETLFFPTLQTCEDGETAWVQLPAEGQDPHELELPAPAIAVVAASDHGHGEHSEESESGAAPAGGSGQLPLLITSLAVGGLGLIAAVVALIRGGKSA